MLRIRPDSAEGGSGTDFAVGDPIGPRREAQRDEHDGSDIGARIEPAADRGDQLPKRRPEGGSRCAPEVASELSRAEKQIHKASEIIRHARAALQGQPPKSARVQVKLVIDEAVELLQASGVTRDVTLRTFGEASETSVDVDKLQIEQVLVNLVRNACEAAADSPEKLVEITTEAEESLVRITIEDSGPGFNEDSAQPFSLFQPGGDGLGVGLAISRTIVEAHGGRISVGHRPTGGASVRIELPA